MFSSISVSINISFKMFNTNTQPGSAHLCCLTAQVAAIALQTTNFDGRKPRWKNFPPYLHFDLNTSLPRI